MGGQRLRCVYPINDDDDEVKQPEILAATDFPKLLRKPHIQTTVGLGVYKTE